MGCSLVWTFAALFTGAAGAAETAPPPAQTDRTIAVMDVRLDDLPASLGATLTEVVTTEVEAVERFEVISSSDIQAVLGLEAQVQMLGCDDESCIAEIAGALGAARILATQVGRVGEVYVVNIKLIDTVTPKSLGRVSKNARGDVGNLVNTLRQAVRELFGMPNILPPPVPYTGPSALSWGLMGGGVVGVLTGALFGVQAQGHADRANDTAVPGSWLQIDEARSDQRIANIAYGVGATAAVTGLLWWLLSDEEPAAEPAPSPHQGAPAEGVYTTTASPSTGGM